MSKLNNALRNIKDSIFEYKAISAFFAVLYIAIIFIFVTIYGMVGRIDSNTQRITIIESIRAE